MMDMIEQSVGQIATDAIDLFVEYRDKHGYSEERAKAQAVADVIEGQNVNLDQLLAEMKEIMS